MRGRRLEKDRLIVLGPDEVDAGAVIDAPSPLARVDRDPAAILGDRQNLRENNPRIVGLPLRGDRQFVAPVEQDAAGRGSASAFTGMSGTVARSS